jgi:hypothetical protein
MSVTKPVNSRPVDVNESSLAVVVVAVSADGGAGVIASSPMNVVSARVARRNDQYVRSESTPYYRPRGKPYASQKARSLMNYMGSYISLHLLEFGRYRGDVLNYLR